MTKKSSKNYSLYVKLYSKITSNIRKGIDARLNNINMKTESTCSLLTYFLSQVLIMVQS